MVARELLHLKDESGSAGAARCGTSEHGTSNGENLDGFWGGGTAVHSTGEEWRVNNSGVGEGACTRMIGQMPLLARLR